jgi:hypothetical protein
VCIFTVGDGTLLHDVLINTDKGYGVTARNIRDWLNLTAHHENCSLDGSDLEVVFGSWNIVGSHDSDLLAGGDDTGEDTTEGVESTLVVSGNKLGDEHHEGSFLVAVLDGLTADIINRAFIEVTSSVLLGLDGGWKLQDDHFNEGISGIDPFLEDILHLFFALELLLVMLKNDLKSLEHLFNGLVVALHAVSAQTDDGLHDELNETSLERCTILSSIFSSPLLTLGIEEVVTPHFLHHFIQVNLELLGVNSGEFG